MSKAVGVSVLVVVFLCFALGFYLLVSRNSNNWINILTPSFLVHVPAFYVLELFRIYELGVGGSFLAYLTCYLLYFSGVSGIAFGYVSFRPKRFYEIFPYPTLNLIPVKSWFFLVLGAVLYAPVLVEYVDLLLQPRLIYEKTRIGYGPSFFLSTVCVYVAVVFRLFEGKKGLFEASIFYFFVFAILLLHGSKIQLVTLAMIVCLFKAFCQEWKVAFPKMFALGAGFSVFIMLLFLLSFSSVDLRDGVLQSIVRYADYTHNSILLLDDDFLSPQMGRLSMENAVFGIVPRSIFPAKPENFGVFFLAERYYPERFALGTGAPAFGIGVGYADFGFVSLVINFLYSMLLGFVAKILVGNLKIRPDPAAFFLLLCLIGVPLIPLGVPISVIVFYIIAACLHLICGGPRKGVFVG